MNSIDFDRKMPNIKFYGGLCIFVALYPSEGVTRTVVLK